MDFAFSGWIFVPIIGLVLSAFIAWLGSTDGFFGDVNPRQYRKVYWVSQLILIVAGNVLFLGGSALGTIRDNANLPVKATICDVTSQMGLTSGAAYPVEVGARVGGSYGNGYFWSGLFSSGGEVSMSPGSALSVGFDYQGKSAILEFPLKRVTFVKDAKPDAKPTIAVELSCKDPVDATQVVHYGPTHLRLDSGVFLMVRDEISRESLMIKKSVAADGLAPLVAANLKSVEIHLSPELYAKILG